MEIDEGFVGELHPLIINTLAKEKPIIVGGLPRDLKHIAALLKDCTDGWQWVTCAFYDPQSTHPVYRFHAKEVIMGFPSKIAVKVPNFFRVDQGEYPAKGLSIGPVGWFLKSLKIVPSGLPTGEANDDTTWLLCSTSNPSLPAQIFRSLEESVSLVVGFTDSTSDMPAFQSALVTDVTDMDSWFIIDWPRWFVGMSKGDVVEVMKECVEEDEEDAAEEDEDPQAEPAPANPKTPKKPKPSPKTNPKTPTRATPPAAPPSALDQLSGKAKPKPQAKASKK